MPAKKFPGQCTYCHKSFPKSGMLKHLSSCAARDKWLNAGERQAQLQRRRILQLLVEGYDLPQYWMLLELPADTTLKQLDDYLRMAWLECCGHMSAFYIGDETYGVRADSSLGHRSMQRAKLGDLVDVGDWFGHDYDFGSTTTLRLGVVGERKGVLAKNRIERAAVNEPPYLPCACGKVAKQVCVVCLQEMDDGGWLCDECATNHACGEDMLLPVVNSPRVGVCGYEGV